MICAVLFGLPANTTAEEIAPGVKYTGPRKLEVSIAGFSFTLPSGWNGGLPQGQQTFIIGRESLNGNLLVVLERATVQEAQQLMSQPSQAFPPMVLTPKTAATVKGAIVSNEFAVSNTQTPFEARAKAKIDASGWGVMVIALAPSEELPTFLSAMDAVLSSAKFEPPKPPSPDNFWARQLAGKRINYFYNASGYSEKRQFSLCANGTFAYSTNSTSVSVNGSGVMQNSNSGRWSTAGDASGGVLNLHYNDGRTAQYRLSLNGDSLFLDNQRYLRENINCN